MTCCARWIARFILLRRKGELNMKESRFAARFVPLNYTNNGTLPDTKECTKCGETFPRDAVHFQPYRGRSVDGLRPICRICERAYNRVQKKLYRAKKKLAGA